jgi:hypothetical protein
MGIAHRFDKRTDSGLRVQHRCLDQQCNGLNDGIARNAELQRQNHRKADRAAWSQHSSTALSRRAPSPSEFAMAKVLRLPIEEGSAKIRSGFPTPYAEDFGLPVWAGVIPMKVGLGVPQIDPNCAPGTPAEDFDHLRRMVSIGEAEHPLL